MTAIDARIAAGVEAFLRRQEAKGYIGAARSAAGVDWTAIMAVVKNPEAARYQADCVRRFTEFVGLYAGQGGLWPLGMVRN